MAKWWSNVAAVVGITAVFGACTSPPAEERKAEPPKETAPAQTPPPPSPTPPPTKQAPTAVSTSKGRFTVPGKAFADGRDLEARPRLTVMQINVWDAAARTRRVCQVKHGEQLELLAATRIEDEDRHYFQIRAKSCEGWLPETFVSTKAERVVGDRQ